MSKDPRSRAEMLAKVSAMQRLATDLAAIVEGHGPTEDDLAGAVSIRDYRLTQRFAPCITGVADRHPRLGSKLITTSQLFAIDPDYRWARTFSRYYRLDGRPIELPGEAP